MPDPVGSFEPRSFGRRDRGAGGPDGKKRSRPEMVWLGSLETTRCRTQASAADRARLRVRAAGMAKVARVRNTQAVPPFCETNLDWTPLRRHAETSEPIPYPSLRAKRSNPGAGVRPSGLLAPRMLWPLDCFVASAPRNDGWVAADLIDSVVIGRRLSLGCFAVSSSPS